MADIFGTDIQLDDNGDFVIGTGGDVSLVSGLDCLMQDVRHRLITYTGDLFCDTSYGVGIQDFINMEDREINRQHLIQQIKVKLIDEPRIKPNSISAKIISWENGKIELEVSFTPIDYDNEVNILIRSDSSGIEVS